MAIVEGIITGIIRDAETGKIKRTFREVNHISDWMLDNMAGVSTGRRLGVTIYITDLPYETTARQSVSYGSRYGIDAGYTASGVTNPVGGGGTSNPQVPYYIQYQQRFDPPPIDRTVRAIGMSFTATVSLNSYMNPSESCVRLSQDCLQSTTETLDVFYRIQFPWTYEAGEASINDYGNTKGHAYVLWYRHFNNGTTAQDQLPRDGTHCGFTGGKFDSRKLIRSYMTSAFAPYHEYLTADYTFTGDGDYSKSILNNVGELADSVGQLVGYMRYGDGDGWSCYHAKSTPEGSSPIQNLFPHGPAADLPFFDPSNLPSGDASVAFGGTWTDPSFPKIYRVEMTATGAIGVATYQLWERECCGFINNTYHNTTRALHSTIPENAPIYDDFNIARDFNGGWTWNSQGPRFVNYRPVDGMILAIRQTSILMWDVSSESGIHINDVNYPAFVPTNITDYSVDSNGDIYIACADTGLYRISDPTGSPSITVIDDTTTGLTGAAGPQVYGVAAGRNDRIWILMDGGLFYSDDDGATWTTATFVFTDISSGRWDSVIQLHADVEHVDDRIALVYGTPAQPTNDHEICWYDLASTTTVAGTYVTQTVSGVNGGISADKWYFDTTVRFSIIDMLIASPSGGLWGTVFSKRTTVGKPTYFTFGTAATVTASSQTTRDWSANVFDTDEDGNQALIAWTNSSYIYVVYKSSDVTQTYTYSDSQANWTGDQSIQLAGYAGRGVWVGNYYQWMMGLGMPIDKTDALAGVTENIVWKKYGWDGGAWVVGDSGSKTTHGTEDAAIDGLTIQFDDNAGAETFVDNDYYTVGLFDGIWLDGSTEYDHTSYIYYKPIQNQTELEVAVIPASTVIPAIMVINTIGAVWQDQTSNITANATQCRISSVYATQDYSRGARTIETVGGALPTNVGGSLTDSHIQMNAQLYTNTTSWVGTNAGQAVFGLSDESVVGNPITYGGIQFGFHVDGQVDIATDDVEISVVESGVTKWTFDGWMNAEGIDNGSGNMAFKIRILVDGSVLYYLGEALVYTSPPGTATATLNYVVDFAGHGAASAGIEFPYFWSTYQTADSFFELGKPGSPGTGRYVEEYNTCDASQSTFLIGGVEATIIEDDPAYVLSAGEIALSRTAGIFKVAAADIGQTLTAEYIVVTDE